MIPPNPCSGDPALLLWGIHPALGKADTFYLTMGNMGGMKNPVWHPPSTPTPNTKITVRVLPSPSEGGGFLLPLLRFEPKADG